MKKREFILTLTFSLPLPSSMLKLPKYRAGGRKLKRRMRVGRARTREEEAPLTRVLLQNKLLRLKRPLETDLISNQTRFKQFGPDILLGSI